MDLKATTDSLRAASQKLALQNASEKNVALAAVADALDKGLAVAVDEALEEAGGEFVEEAAGLGVVELVILEAGGGAGLRPRPACRRRNCVRARIRPWPRLSDALHRRHPIWKPASRDTKRRVRTRALPTQTPKHSNTQTFFRVRASAHIQYFSPIDTT